MHYQLRPEDVEAPRPHGRDPDSEGESSSSRFRESGDLALDGVVDLVRQLRIGNFLTEPYVDATRDRSASGSSHDEGEDEGESSPGRSRSIGREPTSSSPGSIGTGCGSSSSRRSRSPRSCLPSWGSWRSCRSARPIASTWGATLQRPRTLILLGMDYILTRSSTSSVMRSFSLPRPEDQECRP